MTSLNIIKHQAEAYVREAEKLGKKKELVKNHQIPDPNALRKIGDAIYASAKAEAFSEAAKIIEEHGDISSYKLVLKRLNILSIFIVITFLTTILSLLFHF